VGSHPTFDYRSQGGVSIVVAHGDVDLTNVKRLTELLDRAVTEGAGGVALSLEQVAYFDSSTIHAVIACCKRLDALRREMVIVRPSLATAARIFDLLGLDGALRTFGSLDDAIGAVAFRVRDAAGTMAAASPREEIRRWQTSQESASRWSRRTGSKNRN
jgi:anti-anti-sigma factor